MGGLSKPDLKRLLQRIEQDMVKRLSPPCNHATGQNDGRAIRPLLPTIRIMAHIFDEHARYGADAE